MVYRDPEPESLLTRLAEWYTWHAELVWAGVVIAFLFALIAWGLHNEGEKAERACAKMWAATRTSADTIAVLARCELGEDESSTTIVPIFIPSGR